MMSSRALTVIDLQRACDLACGYCHVRAADSGTSAQRGERAAAAARAALAQGATEFVLTGGEPTLEPWLPALIASLHKRGAHVTLETHGALAPETVDRLARAGLQHAVVACNSLNSAVVDAIARRQGTWDKLRAGVRGLLDAGIAVDLTAVVIPENAIHLSYLRRNAATIWPKSQASLGRLWLRPLLVRADRGPLLPVPQLAVVLEDLAGETGLPMAMTPGFELPPCAYSRPDRELPETHPPLQHAANSGLSAWRHAAGSAAMPPAGSVAEQRTSRRSPVLADLLRLSSALVAKEGHRYRRLPACAACQAAPVCPGALPEYAAQLHMIPPLSQLPASAGIDTLSDGELDPHTALQLAPSHRLDPATEGQCLPEPPPLPPPAPWPLPDLAAFDREAWEVLQGWRQVLRREVSSASAAQQVAGSLRSQGLQVQVSGGEPGHTLAAPSWLVWGGQDSIALEQACAVDRQLGSALSQGRSAVALIADLGRLLGYPECCIQAFGAAANSGDATLVQALASQQQKRLLPQQNWAVVPLRWMSHLPCTPDCSATAQRTAAVLHHVHAAHPLWAERALAVLCSPVLAWSYERFAVFAGSHWAEPGVLHYSHVLGLDQFSDARSLLQRRSWRMFAAEILGKLRLGDHVRIAGPCWQVLSGKNVVAELTFQGSGPQILRFDGSETPDR